METTVLLVRHAQITSNVTSIYAGRSSEDLSETGYAQARRLSSRLSDLPIVSVYSSPLTRTLSTATVVAEPHGLSVVPLDDLVEIDLGEWQGLHEDEVKRRWRDLWSQSKVDPSELAWPGGESFGQVAERAARAFKAVAAAHAGSTVVVVTHDVVVRTIVAHILGVANNVYRRLQIGNASLSVVVVVEGAARLITLNDISHLDGLTAG